MNNNKERDEPLTPAGRLFLQPAMEQVINCVFGFKNPIDVDAIRSVFVNSALIKHPRFSSLMVKDRHGREYWRKTQIDLDRHIIILNEPIGEVNDYLADLSVSTPLTTEKPLWEIHLLMPHDCAVLRVHHALGDGISLMSMLLSCCRKADDPNQLPTINNPSSNTANGRGITITVLKLLKVLYFSVLYVVQFVLRSLWVKDKKTVVSGGDGVELWPRNLATARFSLDDMKMVKNAVAHATINDVLFGVISAGLSKYLDMRSPKPLQEGLQITGVAMVNLRPQPGLQEISKLMTNNSGTRWGNKFGMILLPIYYHKSDFNALEYLKRAKLMIDRKKLSLEAQFSYKIGEFVMSLFGSKLASFLNYRIVCNTTFTISNVIGPREEITIAGNPVTYIRVNSTSLPHAITMHMVSYAGWADMQILVPKDIIPDHRFLAKCFEDALHKMKQAVEVATKT